MIALAVVQQYAEEKEEERYNSPMSAESILDKYKLIQV